MPPRDSVRSLIRAAMLALAATGLALLLLWLPEHRAMAGPAALTFTVNSTADVPDAHPGDGVCETAANSGVCTLRAAVQETNARQARDTILLPAGTYELTRPGQDDTALDGDLDISSTVTIAGAGPDSTVIDGNGGVTGDRVFDILTGTVVISGVTIQHGHVSVASQNGGGIQQRNGALTLENSAVFSNTSTGGAAGGIYSQGVLTIEHSQILSNTAQDTGGGVNSGGLLLVRNSAIGGNSADKGGGLDIASNLPATVLNSTVNGNVAQTFGGGIRTNANTDVVNSTIAGNSSDGDAGGMGVDFRTTRLFNVTVVDNIANADGAGSGIGGGIFTCSVVTCTGPPTVTLQNSIVARNGFRSFTVFDSAGTGVILHTVPDDCAGPIISLSHNILSAVNASDCTVNGSFVLTDPLLSPLADNGGPTLTELPQPGSPAIDAGTPGGCTNNLGAVLTTDQRGAARPVGAACDVGATEAGATPTLTALSPGTAAIGSPTFSLTVDGTNFIEGTVALWNGSPRATTVLSSTQLSVTIPAGDLTATEVVTVAARYTTLTDTLSNALPFTVTKLDQTIAFGPLPDHTFGDAPFTVSATATSGLAVGFSATGSCTVAANTVTLTGAGSCTITASQPGNTTFNPAPPVQQSFNIAGSGPTGTPLSQRVFIPASPVSLQSGW
jgi:CSLREA domain-containing protein